VFNITNLKFFKDVLIVGSSQAIVGIGTFLILPLITKTLGPYSYGVWSQITITITLLTSLALLGLSQTMIRFLAVEKDPEKIKERFFSILFFVMGFGLTISVAIFFLSDILASIIFNDISISYLIKAGSFLILFTALATISTYYFRIFQQTIKLSIFMISQSFGQLFLMYAFISLGLGILGAIIGSLLIKIFIFLVSISFVIKEIGFAIPEFSMLSTFIRYGLPMAPNQIIDWLIASNATYIITFYLGYHYQGIYSAAYVIGSITMILVSPIQLILLPRLSQLYDEFKIDQVGYLFNDSVKYFALIAIPAAFGISFLGLPLLNIVTTPEFSTGAILIPFIAFGGVFFGVNIICINIMQLVKKTHISFYLYLFTAIISISLNLLLIPIIGTLGAAISVSISYVVMAGTTYLVTFRYIKIHIDYKFFIKSIVASVFMGFVLFLLHPITMIQIISSVIFGILIYFLLMIIFKGIRKNEIKLINSILVDIQETWKKLLKV
jgi:O-antigen/teichoic acid export membrane protein